VYKSTNTLPKLNLNGERVWLSGSIPEPEGEIPDIQSILEAWQGSELERGILGFVQEFASLVMNYGGEIIHGRHPSFTPVLLECARRHSRSQGEEPLELCATNFWPEEYVGDWDRWRRFAKVTITAATEAGDDRRDASLAVLRNYMAKRCTAFVAIGGRWWSKIPGRAGVPKEFELAKAMGVPCFILGGFGGVTQTYVIETPDYLDGLRNGLNDQQNASLASDTNFVLAAGKIAAQLQILNERSAANEN